MSERGDFRCPKCPLWLKDVTLPVHHVCRGSVVPQVAAPRRDVDTVAERAAALGVDTCRHRGEVVERIVCRGCGSRGLEVDVYACGVHGRCHLVRANDHRSGMDCRLCAIGGEGFEPGDEKSSSP